MEIFRLAPDPISPRSHLPHSTYSTYSTNLSKFPPGPLEGEGHRVGPDYWNLTLGDQVAGNAFTNYDTLGALIGKYNTDVNLRDEALTIDPVIIEVRDLLAHGRVSSRTPDLSEMAIVKFDRPVNGQVTVVACARMTDSWLDAKIKLAHDLTMKVHAAYERFAI